ncbi:hypothetical protein PPYR_00540 [Photinus pyralis]|uniref:Seipin n=1 Tax=Photinus pyralis TaxID=7054 RepID=A0A1Y1LIE7_PHOPY|nr:seipin [Photinus pyralis]XP_031328733.1 seipin [Photinus pyralis]KAB0803570.1 hypothetical protein PPYR_00540 [Photinus pyralis]
MVVRRFLSTFWFIVRHPKQFYKTKVSGPLIKFVYETVQLYRLRTRKGIDSVRELFLRGTIVAAATSVLVWLSIFMYMAFYYVYVPTISHERPVFLQFKACQDAKGICSFPSAHIQLTKRQQLLMYGQPYKIHLELEMPESRTNRELGMFMVCADFRGQDGSLVTSSCRSAMLHYRSVVIDTLYKLVFIPLFILGTVEEKQKVYVELFAEYEDKETAPVTDVYLEIQTKYIQLYSAKFFINAQFSGLRYFMFHWPLVSATIGITSNLFFIAIVCIITWYQLILSDDYRNYESGIAANRRLEYFKGNVEDDSSSFDEDTSFLQEASGNEKDYLEERKILDDIKPVTVEQ